MPFTVFVQGDGIMPSSFRDALMQAVARFNAGASSSISFTTSAFHGPHGEDVFIYVEGLDSKLMSRSELDAVGASLLEVGRLMEMFNYDELRPASPYVLLGEEHGYSALA